MKTKDLLIPTIMVFVALFNASCFSEWNAVSGKGNIISESRSATDFNSIELQTAADVEVVKGDSFQVNVSDYENLIQYLTVEVTGNRLIIKKEPGSVNLWNSKAKVTVTLPALYSLKLSGSGNMNVRSPFNNLQSLTVLGSGNIGIASNCQLSQLEAQVTGSGNIDAVGTVNELTTKISGSGNIHFAGLKAKNATCTVSGSGNMYVFIENQLDVYLSGSGDIVYYGTPVVNSYVSGSGRVYHK